MFSRDNTKLASAGYSTVKVWELSSGKERFVSTGRSGLADFRGVAFSPDGKQLAVGSRRRHVRIWDLATEEEVLSLTEHTGNVTGVAFEPDGKTIASIASDGSLKIWHATTGREIFNLRGHSDLVPPNVNFDRSLNVAFSTDGRRIATSSSDGTVRIWDAASGRLVLDFRGRAEWNDKRTWSSVAFSPNGNYLASTTGDGMVRIWDATPLPK